MRLTHTEQEGENIVMNNKKWKLAFKKLPDETVINTLMPVVAPTEKEAVRLGLLSIALSNLKNESVESIEIVSCNEID
jgi:hypothetical protein